MFRVQLRELADRVLGQKLAQVASLDVEGLGQLDDRVLVDGRPVDVVVGSTLSSDLAFNHNY